MKLIDKFPENIRTIIFDFGGVVMDINTTRTIAAFANLNIGLKPDDIISSHKRFLYDLEVGNCTPNEFIHTIYQEYPAASGVSDKIIWNAWNALLGEYDQQRIALLVKLKKDYNLYLLSNTNFPHRVKFREIYRRQFGENFDDLFIRCFYSDELHLRKPDAEIYNQVIKIARIDPATTLFIDDNEANVTAARTVGLQAYHLSGKEKITDLFVD